MRRLAFLLAACLLAASCGRKEPGAQPTGGAAGSSASTPADAEQATSLTDVDWILIRLGDKTVPPIGRKQIQLRFASGEKVARGEGICNTFESPFEMDEAGLRFGPLAVTRKNCSLLDDEKRFFAAIQATSRFSLGGGSLILSDAAGKQVAEFALNQRNAPQRWQPGQ